MMWAIVIYVSVCAWILVGAVAALCAVDYCGVKPSLPKIIAALIIGPLAINRKWWDVQAS